MSERREVKTVGFTRIDYSGHAPRYDQQRFHGDKNTFLESLRRRTLWRLIHTALPDSRVLDVGCGTGRGILYLRSAGFRNVHGLDFTTAMLQRAKEKLEAQATPDSTRLIRGDAFAIAFPDNCFDLVVSLNFIHLFQFDLQKRVVHELCRVCRRGGLVVVEFENIHKGFLGYRFLEQFLHRKSTKLNSAREIHQLFPPDLFREISILGTDLPLAHRVLKYVPRIGKRVESLTYLPGLRWCAARIVVGARKG